jgi:hypothetical protein
MDMSGIDAVIALRTQFPDARTIILSTFDCAPRSTEPWPPVRDSYMLKTISPHGNGRNDPGRPRRQKAHSAGSSDVSGRASGGRDLGARYRTAAQTNSGVGTDLVFRYPTRS